MRRLSLATMRCQYWKTSRYGEPAMTPRRHTWIVRMLPGWLLLPSGATLLPMLQCAAAAECLLALSQGIVAMMLVLRSVAAYCLDCIVSGT